jgi:hypothetical protein
MVYFSSAIFAGIDSYTISGDTTINKVSSSKKSRKEKGDTLVFYEVLRLKDLNYSNNIMVVYVQTVIETRRSSAKMHAKYLLKRERQYLAKIFFSSVEILKSEMTDLDPLQSFTELSGLYKGISLWTILHANQFFNRTHAH